MAREDHAYETQRQQQPLHYENRPTVSSETNTKLAPMSSDAPLRDGELFGNAAANAGFAFFRAQFVA
jgi:hypothetical protein